MAVDFGMRRLLGAALVGLLAQCMALAGSAERDYSDGPAKIAPRQHAPNLIHERHGSNATSFNWSGYAITGADVSDVKGSWKVPAIQGTCPSTTQYSSFWVGIDGYDSNTVEQIGTDSDCQNGSPVYYAWYEFYPHFSYNIPIKVQVGDVISAEVSYLGGKFTLSITVVNLTDMTSESWSTSQKTPNAKRSSAEWIIEAPSGSGGVSPLADFGTVAFGIETTIGTPKISLPCSATVGNATGPIGSAAFTADVVELSMVASDGKTVISQPSNLSADGGSFTDAFVP